MDELVSLPMFSEEECYVKVSWSNGDSSVSVKFWYANFETNRMLNLQELE
jgi:hypothetical protein